MEDDWIPYNRNVGVNGLPPPHTPVSIKVDKYRCEYIEAGQVNWETLRPDWKLARHDLGWIPWRVDSVFPDGLPPKLRVEVIMWGRRRSLMISRKDISFERYHKRVSMNDIVAYRIPQKENQEKFLVGKDFILEKNY